MPRRLLHDSATSSAMYHTQAAPFCLRLQDELGSKGGREDQASTMLSDVECRATCQCIRQRLLSLASNAALRIGTRWEIPLSSERWVTRPGRSFTPFGFKGFPPICQSPRILRMWAKTNLIKLQICWSPSHSGSEHGWGWAFEKRCKRPQPVYSLSCCVSLAASWAVQIWIGTHTQRYHQFHWLLQVTCCARPC